MRLKHFFAAILLLSATQTGVLNASAFDDDGGFYSEHFTYDDRLAPIKLEYVDFKISRNRTVDEWGKNIGQYTFNLFGCRRMQKDLILNQGRVMRRDMKFFDVFFEELNDIFPVVTDKDNRYFPYSIGDKIPGYVVSAEIKDLYVNACDHYDWRTRNYPHLRSGSAEIKVLWRITTPFDRKLVWEGQTSGYASIKDPIKDGEIRLIEKAFGDSLVRMTGMPGVIETLRNKPDEEDLLQEKLAYEKLLENHRQNRRSLVSSYRRNRLFFYGEDKKKVKFTSLDRLAGRLEDITSEQLEIEQLKKTMESALTEEQKAQAQKKLASLQEKLAEKGKDIDSDLQSSLYGRLLKEKAMESGIYGRLLPASSKLIRLFETFDVGSPLGQSAFDSFIKAPNLAKYGFDVTPEGWITINNEKPFRYLTPQRIYRVRSSVVAITGGGDVSSGVLIAPSLILTNFTAAAKAPSVKVRFLDGREISALVLRVSKMSDAALLYIAPENRETGNWPLPLRIDLPDVGEKFYAVGTPMRGGYEGALEPGKVSGYRYTDFGVEILTDTTVQSVTLGGILVDESGNAIGIAHAGKSVYGNDDAFIPIGDAFHLLKVRIKDRFDEETPTRKARRLLENKNYIK